VSYLTLLLIFAVSTFTGLYGAVIGGSLLVLVPMLIFLGVPAHIALGTAKLSSLCRDLPAIANYHKGGHVRFGTGIVFTFFGMIGTLCASLFILTLKTETLEQIISIVMLASAAFILSKPDSGLKTRTPLPRSLAIFLSMICGLAVGLYSGIFGGGVNVMIIMSLVFIFGFDYLAAVATAKITSILLVVVFIGVFGAHGQINYILALPMALGMALGGHLGSKLALARGNSFVRYLLLALIAAMAIKLMFM